MLLAFLSFIVGLALLVLVLYVLFSRKNDKNLNIYSLLIIASAGIQRFLQGVEEFNLIDSFKNPLVDNFLHQFFLLVFSYLFFDNLLFKKTPVKKVILHLVFPTLFVLVHSLFNLDPGLVKLVARITDMEVYLQKEKLQGTHPFPDHKKLDLLYFWNLFFLLPHL